MLKNPDRVSRRVAAGPGQGGITWDESNLEANEVIKAGLSSVRINEPKTPYHGPLDPLDPDHMDHDEGLQPLALDESHSMNGRSSAGNLQLQTIQQQRQHQQLHQQLEQLHTLQQSQGLPRTSSSAGLCSASDIAAANAVSQVDRESEAAAALPGGSSSGTESASRSVGGMSECNMLDSADHVGYVHDPTLSVGSLSREGGAGAGSSTGGGGAAGRRGRGTMEDGGEGEPVAPPVMMTVGGRRPRSSDLRTRAYANGNDGELGQASHTGGELEPTAPHEMTEAQHAHFAAMRKSHYNMREAMKRARKQEEEDDEEEMGSEDELGREADRHS